MKANRILFDRLKQQWDLLKMKSAYIAAEQEIIQNSSNGMADGISFGNNDIVPEQKVIEFFQDEFGNLAAEEVTVKDQQIRKLEQQLKELEETGRKLLEDENYELMEEARELYDITKRQLDKLRGN